MFLSNLGLFHFGSAGVWGATLSSALGGILGGPKILQAMSLDNITLSSLPKNQGLIKSQEILCFNLFIAGGILIGELNVIAELVAML